MLTGFETVVYEHLIPDQLHRIFYSNQVIAVPVNTFWFPGQVNHVSSAHVNTPELIQKDTFEPWIAK